MNEPMYAHTHAYTSKAICGITPGQIVSVFFIHSIALRLDSVNPRISVCVNNRSDVFGEQG